MAKQHAVTREQIVERAYALAVDRGLASVSIRAIATECGVATGTIYNYFPTKDDLTMGVIGHFWREELSDVMERAATPGCDYIEFCQSFYEEASDALVRFRRDWLPQLRASAEGGQGMRCPEASSGLDHMRAGLAGVLRGDPHIDQTRLGEDLSPEQVAGLTLSTLIEFAGERKQSFDAFCQLLRLALYDSSSSS